ncbi:hypothetical protein F4810DRAFT_687784 [Camillea tinctor]|nr:hypothetical protein F4810DRAFT_687784 [Camillea tinctor]
METSAFNKEQNGPLIRVSSKTSSFLPFQLQHKTYYGSSLCLFASKQHWLPNLDFTITLTSDGARTISNCAHRILPTVALRALIYVLGMPETWQPYDYIPPPTRQEIIDSCPGFGASPTQVRDWLWTYLLYRGLNTDNAGGFFWRGTELHQATIETLVAAFKNHCRVKDWEADILANDVFTIIENSIPPPHRTLFQRYVESLFGSEFYSKLARRHKPVLGFFEYVNCIFCWIGLLIVHIGLGFIFAVIVRFLFSTS